MGPVDSERGQVSGPAVRNANTDAYGFADTNGNAYWLADLHAERVAEQGEHAY
jgi:hypothetical protein